MPKSTPAGGAIKTMPSSTSTSFVAVCLADFIPSGLHAFIRLGSPTEVAQEGGPSPVIEPVGRAGNTISLRVVGHEMTVLYNRSGGRQTLGAALPGANQRIQS